MKKMLLPLIICFLFLFALISEEKKSSKIDFATQIYPFVKSGCVKCHRPPYEKRGRMKKPKGGFILSTKEGIMSAKGGKDEDKPFITPRDPEKSLMVYVTNLPLDHDDHFPPEGKAPQWTDAEKKLFAEWISQGADFGNWKEDPKPSEGLEWDKVEKAPGTLEVFKK